MAATPVMTQRARAIQRTTRQSPYKMRLVIDQIRGKNVNDALALLRFSKKHAAKQIEKTLSSAVANAEYKARIANEAIDLDLLVVSHAVVNEGPSLKRFMPAAQGRATPIRKRTSHVDIIVSERAAKAKPAAKPAAKKAAAKKATARKTTAKTAAKKTAKKTEGEN
jgi:large subunit ribosomal protein L22